MGRSLLGRLLSNSSPVPMAPAYRRSGFMTGSSGAVDSKTLMGAYGAMGTVWSIVSLYSAAVGAPEWHLYRKQPVDGRTRYTTRDEGSDQRTEVIRHQALSVLNKPNPFYSRFSLFETSQMYLELTGESYWIIDRDPRATFPIGLWPVRPDRMEPVPDPKAYLRGYIYTSPDGQEKIPLAVDDVIMVKYPNPLDPYHGLGPLQSVLVDIQAAQYSAQWNKNFFFNSAVPGGVVQVDHRMSDDEWDEFQERWMSAHRGVARAHRVAMLEGGMTWVPNAMTMRDMDFANLRGVSRDVIREAWRMHKVMLGVSDDVNRANAQTGEEVFSSWGVVPRLDRWNDAINNQFLPMFGSTGDGVEFSYVRPVPANRELDNLELTSKSNAAALLVTAGFDSTDVCKVVGLPDMGFQAPAPPAAATEPSTPADETGVPSEDTADFTAALRKMLSNGHQPAGSLR